MKSNPTSDLASKLRRVRDQLGVLSDPQSRVSLLANLDELIDTLGRLRAGLSNQALEEEAREVQRPLDQVIRFLELARNESVLCALLLPAGKTAQPKSRRQAVEIQDDLTNEQIRDLLTQKLSKAELKLIARQRSISVAKSSVEEIRRDILRNLERQEGYGRLASS